MNRKHFNEIALHPEARCVFYIQQIILCKYVSAPWELKRTLIWLHQSLNHMGVCLTLDSLKLLKHKRMSGFITFHSEAVFMPNKWIGNYFISPFYTWGLGKNLMLSEKITSNHGNNGIFQILWPNLLQFTLNEYFVSGFVSGFSQKCVLRLQAHTGEHKIICPSYLKILGLQTGILLSISFFLLRTTAPKTFSVLLKPQRHLVVILNFTCAHSKCKNAFLGVKQT